MTHDIYISYKRRISLATANNLYYRLITRGYSVFFDLEEMRKDNFDSQIQQNIKKAKDIIIILEEGSLDSCKGEEWEKDWFCKEIMYALQEKKNIIPILLNGYKMPDNDSLPNELKGLTLKNSPEFSFAFIDKYIDKLIEQDYITSLPIKKNSPVSIFKISSNEKCEISENNKIIYILNDNKPFYLPVFQKGEHFFSIKNLKTDEIREIKKYIEENQEKTIEIKWEKENPTPIVRWTRTLIKRSGLPSILFFTITAIAFFIVCFGIGCGVGLYEYRYDISDYKDITNYVYMTDSVTILYQRNGIKAYYDISTNIPQTDDRNSFKTRYASATEFILATTVSKIFYSTKNLKFLRTGGGNWKTKLGTILSSFVGTIFGYSFGKQYGTYIQRRDLEEDMKDLLKKPSTWEPAIDMMRRGKLIKEPYDELEKYIKR